MVFYTIFQTPTVVQERWRKHFDEYKLLLINNVNKPPNYVPIDLSFRKTAIHEYNFMAKVALVKRINDQLGNKEHWSFMEVSIYNLVFVLTDRGFLYLGSTLSLSIGALILESAFFYSIQLLEIIQHFEMLKNVINAVTQNISQVLYATFFGNFSIFPAENQ